VLEDNAQALKWYRKAAAQNDAMAQYNLASMYDNGEVVEEDKAKALEWYVKAAYGGHKESPNYIGILYDNGEGAPEDDIAACAWWLIGIKRGDNAPQNNMDYLAKKLTPEQLSKAKLLSAKLETNMATKK